MTAAPTTAQTDYKIVTITTLVRNGDAENVRDGHINLATHDESMGAYSTIRNLTEVDMDEWGEVIADAADYDPRPDPVLHPEYWTE